MITIRLYTALAALCLFAACNNSGTKTSSTSTPRSGNWELKFDVGDGVEIPVRLNVDSMGKWSLKNWTETIPLDDVVWNEDSFHVMMPYFHTALHGRMEGDSTMSGKWFDYTRSGNYSLTFSGSIPEAMSSYDRSKERNFPNTFEVTFSPDSAENRYNAVGIFTTEENRLFGTFLTETGDYRYLQGAIKSESESPDIDDLHLSCFDGTHLFLFTGKLHHEQGTIRDGMFYSGSHHKEPWSGVVNAHASLRHPDSLTFMKPEFTDFSFDVKNMNADSVHFDKKNFEGKVCLVQILGTWCPNCTDESLWLKSLYEKYQGRGIEIIPVAFERGDNERALMQNVQRQFAQLKIPYEPYLGGDKSNSQEVFPMLNHVMSYPTLIILDKKGMVRKIHTGFYGPGTGTYFNTFSERLEMFVEQLLDE
ncbi:MAG: TlpA disulfide reductase family protein [Flavobacteriales bacterium]|nr:TlpA disulfide reductase family protein [Flavobacteriales bacterium]